MFYLYLVFGLLLYLLIGAFLHILYGIAFHEGTNIEKELCQGLALDQYLFRVLYFNLLWPFSIPFSIAVAPIVMTMLGFAFLLKKQEEFIKNANNKKMEMAAQKLLKKNGK